MKAMPKTPGAIGLIVLVLVGLISVGRPEGLSVFPQLQSPTVIERRTAATDVVSPDGIIHGAWYDLAFTRPTLSGRREEESSAERLLIDLINRGQTTVDVAIHDLDLESVTGALAAAAGRGVRVRVVLESEIVRSNDRERRAAVDALRSAGIPFVEDRANALMHHKFTVVDGRWVETGSWNYTFSETYRNNNNAIVIESRDLAENFTAEFEKMFVGRQFGGAKPRGVPHASLNLAGARTENYFSPQDRSAAQVIRWVGTARQQLHFLAFSFTHDGIGDAVLDRYRNGVTVGGVFEDANTRDTFSEYGKLRSAGVDVLLDRNPWNLHHKVIVLDRTVAIFGSFNFSASADRDNDENLLIVDDPGLAEAFEREYARIREIALTPR
jgi:phosphatidylserine/phosphatidylglycerophosphate/cardiolipin synthase-like enzyme